MNGRVYDYNLGRFLSVDPFIQDPGNSQSINPYSYIMNNPLAGVDPSGYSSEAVVMGKDDKLITMEDGTTYLDQGGDSLVKVDSVKVESKNGSSATFSFGGSGNISGVSLTSANGDSLSITDIGSEQQKATFNGQSISNSNGEVSDNSQDNDSLIDSTGRVASTILFDSIESAKTLTTLGFLLPSLRNPNPTQTATEGNIAFGLPFLTGLGGLAKSLSFKLGTSLCFVEGTLIHTKDGLKPIEKIEVGELVASKDEVTGKVDWKPVVQLFKNENKSIINITFFSESGSEEVLGVTKEHPFRVNGKGWVKAGDLKVDDKLISLQNKSITVKSIENDEELHTTYNFEVADFHTYFVGDEGVWVHNTCVDIAKKLAAEITGDFKCMGACKEFAASLQQKLQSAGVKGERLDLKSTTDFLLSDANGIITTNGSHSAIRIGDTVFDNLNPKGIKLDKFIDDLGGQEFFDAALIKLRQTEF